MVKMNKTSMVKMRGGKGDRDVINSILRMKLKDERKTTFIKQERKKKRKR